MQLTLRKANERRGRRVADELAAMRPLVVARLAEFTEEDVTVSEWSTIRIRHNSYSVPSRLIEQTVRVRLFEDRIEVWFADKLQLSCERLRGRNQRRVDYRHIIWSLIRKPGGFARYVYRDEMFPSLVFRRAYDAIQTPHHGTKGDLEYLRILHLAASTVEADVAAALELLLAESAAVSSDAVRAIVSTARRPEIPALSRPDPDVDEYDSLLGDGVLEETHQLREGRHVTTTTTTAPPPPLLPSRWRFCFARSSCRRLRAWQPTWRRRQSERHGPSDSTFTISPRLEVEERRRRRIERYLRDSDLPAEKTLATLERQKLPAKVQKQLPTLCEGGFVDRGDNLLAFGLPGRGKSHLVCAIGHELVRRGRRVLFTPTYALVQRLLAAKRDLRLEKELETLDGFDAVILDDIGYVQQNRDEMGPLHVPLRALRAQDRHHHEQPRLQRVGPHLQGPDDDGGGHRQARAPLRDHRDDRAEHPQRGRKKARRPADDNYVRVHDTDEERTIRAAGGPSMKLVRHRRNADTSSSGRRARSSSRGGAKARAGMPRERGEALGSDSEHGGDERETTTTTTPESRTNTMGRCN